MSEATRIEYLDKVLRAMKEARGNAKVVVSKRLAAKSGEEVKRFLKAAKRINLESLIDYALNDLVSEEDVEELADMMRRVEVVYLDVGERVLLFNKLCDDLRIQTKVVGLDGKILRADALKDEDCEVTELEVGVSDGYVNALVERADGKDAHVYQIIVISKFTWKTVVLSALF